MELLSLNFGQCGLQLADTYWTNLANNFTSNFGEQGPYTSFYTIKKDAEFDIKNPDLTSLNPRCLLIDTETGTSDKILANAKQNLFTKYNVLSHDESSVGNFINVSSDLGPKYWKPIKRYVAKMMEKCNHLEYFNLTFGIGGATGSALGSYTAQMLNKTYPKVPIITNVVYDKNSSPIAPYNNMFSLSVLQDCSTMIIPFSNNNIIESINSTTKMKFINEKNDYFNLVNSVISNFAQLFNNVTVFPDSRHNRIGTLKNTLLPFEKMNYICPLKSPVIEQGPNRKYLLDDLYDDLLIPETRISPIPTNSNMMPITISVLNGVKNSNLVHSSVRRMKNGSFTWRNEERKISTNSFSQSRTITTTKPLIALTNHTGISHYLDRVCDKVESLFHKKAFIHQFKDLIDDDEIRFNLMKLRETSDMYKVQDELISLRFRMKRA